MSDSERATERPPSRHTLARDLWHGVRGSRGLGAFRRAQKMCSTKKWIGIDGRFIVVVLLAASLFAPFERLHEFVNDATVFKIVFALFVIVSVIGTGVVLRCGELPGDDEMFNFGEAFEGLSATQQAALRGDHVKKSSAAAAG